MPVVMFSFISPVLVLYSLVPKQNIRYADTKPLPCGNLFVYVQRSAYVDI